MESIGTRLRNKRDSKRLSLEDVYKKIKIHPDVLRALEEDRFSILSPVYIKGFLKNYSTFLGLDRQEIIDEYNSLGVARGSPRLEPKSTSLDRLRPKISLKFSFIIGGLIIILVFLSFVISALGKKKTKASIPPEVRDTLKSTVKQKQFGEAKSDKAVIITSPPRLGLRAKQNCWVKVRLDGKTVFQGTLRKGQSESWQAKERIEVSIGNASAIELEANGRILSPLGRGRETIKDIVITKDAVSAGK